MINFFTQDLTVKSFGAKHVVNVKRMHKTAYKTGTRKTVVKLKLCGIKMRNNGTLKLTMPISEKTAVSKKAGKCRI